MEQKTPRRTAGHHFSDYLACPKRAWLHYFGNYKEQVKDPAYLRALQQEGLQFEREIYKNLYPNAKKISSRGIYRIDETFDAMKSGEPVILQGYVCKDDGEGVIDILELVGQDTGSITGHSYKVGEIKSSEILKTSHVFQVAWYTDLLEEIYKQKCREAFFILGNSQRESINLMTIWPDYLQIKQKLFQLRNSLDCPNPYLSIYCPSCHWRNICMSELIKNKDISLLPGINRTQIDKLSSMKISTWDGVKELPDSVLGSIGLGKYEIEQIKIALRQLEIGNPPLKKSLRSNLLSQTKVVVLEFPELKLQRRSHSQLKPSAIYYEEGDDIRMQMINSKDENIDTSPFIGKENLIFYGKTDLVVFRSILAVNGIKIKKRHTDLLDLIENNVHCPVKGLELHVLIEYITGKAVFGTLDRKDRVLAIRAVINWLKQSL